MVEYNIVTEFMRPVLEHSISRPSKHTAYVEVHPPGSCAGYGTSLAGGKELRQWGVLLCRV